MDKPRQFFLFVNATPLNLAFFKPTVKVDNETVQTPFSHPYKEGSVVCLQPQLEVGTGDSIGTVFVSWRIDGVEERSDRVLVINMDRHHTIEMNYAPLSEGMIIESIATGAATYENDFDKIMEEYALEVGSDEVDRLIASGEIITPNNISLAIAPLLSSPAGTSATINRFPLNGNIPSSAGIIVSVKTKIFFAPLGVFTIPSGQRSITIDGNFTGLRVRIGDFKKVFFGQTDEQRYNEFGILQGSGAFFMRWKVDGVPSGPGNDPPIQLVVGGGNSTYDCEFMSSVGLTISPSGCADTNATISPADLGFSNLPATFSVGTQLPGAGTPIGETIGGLFGGASVAGFYPEGTDIELTFANSGLGGDKGISCGGGIDQKLSSTTVNGVEHTEHPVLFTVGGEGKAVQVVGNFGDKIPGGPGILTFSAKAGTRPLPNFPFAYIVTNDGNPVSNTTQTDADGNFVISAARVGSKVEIVVADEATADSPNFSGTSGFVGWRFGPGDEPPMGDPSEEEVPIAGGGRQLTFSPTDDFTSKSINVTAAYGPIGDGVTLQRTGVNMDIPVELLRLSLSDGTGAPDDITPISSTVGEAGATFFPKAEFATGFIEAGCEAACNAATPPPGPPGPETFLEECLEDCKQPTYVVTFPNLVRCEGDDFKLDRVRTVMSNDSQRGSIPEEFPASGAFGRTDVGITGSIGITLIADYEPASVPYRLTIISDPTDSVAEDDFDGVGLRDSGQLAHIRAPLLNNNGGRFVRWEAVAESGENDCDEETQSCIPECPSDETDFGDNCYFVTEAGDTSPSTEVVLTRNCTLKAVYDDATGETGTARPTVTLQTDRDFPGCPPGNEKQFLLTFLGAQLSARPDPDNPNRLIVSASPFAADGANFVNWTKSGSGTLTNSGSPEAKFEPGAGVATLTANYTGGVPCFTPTFVVSVTLAADEPTTLKLGGGASVANTRSISGNFNPGIPLAISAAALSDSGSPFQGWSGPPSGAWVNGTGSTDREATFVPSSSVTVIAKYGSGLTPPEIGACIDHLTGICRRVSPEQCSNPEDEFLGVNSPCPDKGGCILPDGTCIVTTAEECAIRGGVFRGLNTVCVPGFLTIEFLADPLASATVEGSTDGVIFKTTLSLPDDEVFENTVLNMVADLVNSSGRLFDAWDTNDGANTGVALEYDSDTLNDLLTVDDTKVYNLFRVGPDGGTITARYQRTFTLDSNPPGAEITITRNGEPFDPDTEGFSDGDRLVLRAPSVFGGNNFILWTITSASGQSQLLTTPGSPEVEIEVFGDTTVTANYQTLAPATITLVSDPIGTVSDSFPAAVGDIIQPGSTLLGGVAPLLTNFGKPFLRWELTPGDPGTLLNPENRGAVTFQVFGDATLTAVYDETPPHPADTVEPPIPDFQITPLEALHYYDAGVTDTDWPIDPNASGPPDNYTAKGNELYRIADARYFHDPLEVDPASWKSSLLLVDDSATAYDLEGPQGGDFIIAGDTFPFSATARSFTFENRTDLNIQYRISTETWLTLTPVSNSGGAESDGSIRNVLAPGETHEISVDVNDNTRLLSVGLHAGTIEFENVTPGLDGIGTISVVTSVNVATAMVTPSTNLVSDGAEGGPFTPSQRIYTLTNNFGGPINFDVEITESWLDLNGTPGPTSVNGTIPASNSVQITIDVNTAADSLVPDEYSDTIVFQNTSNHIGDATRRVELTVLPHLLVEPEDGLLSFGRNGSYDPSSKAYIVTNTTESTIDFDVAVIGEPWLTVTDEPEFVTTPPPTTSPPGFLAPGEARVVTASINSNADALPEGPAIEQLSFTTTSGGGSGNTTRDVTLEIIPTMSVRPIENYDSTATVGGVPNPAFKDYTIRNTGDAPIDYSVSKNLSFLTIDDDNPEPITTVPPGPLTGTLDSGESVVITVRVDPDTSSVAVFADTVTFTNLTDGDGSTTRTVTATVVPAIVLPDTDFASDGPAGGPFNPATETYTVQNTTGGPFDYTVTHFSDFVSLTDGGGTGAPPVVTVDSDGLTTVSGTLVDGENRDVVVGFNDNAVLLEEVAEEAVLYGDTLAITTSVDLDTTRGIGLTVNVPLALPAADRTATGAEGGPFDLTGIPNPGFPDWVSFGDFEYTLTSGQATWPEAMLEALALGGDLAFIDSQEENDFLLSQFPETVWIGLIRIGGSYVWISDTGTTPVFLNFTSGAPDDRAHGLMNAINIDGKWLDAPAGGYNGVGYKGIVKRVITDNPRPVYTLTNNLDLPIQISVSADVDWLTPSLKKVLPSSENLLVNPGAETGDLTGWTETVGTFIVGGPGITAANPFTGPFTGDKFFHAGPVLNAQIEQEIDLLALGFTADLLDSGPRITTGGWQNSFGGSDDGRITVQFLDGPGGLVIDSFVGPFVAPFPNWEPAVDTRILPSGTRAVNYIFRGERDAGTANNSYLDGAFVFFQATAVDTISIDPGETAVLDVTINSNANILTAGDHTGIVTITNVTTDEGTTARDIVLTIVEAPITPPEPFESSGPRVDGVFSGPTPAVVNAGTAVMSFGLSNDYTGTGTASYTVTVPVGVTTIPPVGTTIPPAIELDWTSTLGTFGTVVVSSGVESEVELGITIVVDDIDLLAEGDSYDFTVTMTPLFVPESKTYTISNPGSPVFAYKVSKTQPWLSIATEAPEFLTTPPPMTTAPPVFGDGPLFVIVNPNQSVDVTVAINEGANALPIGLVEDTLEFTEPLPEELNTVANCCADNLVLDGWTPGGAGNWLTTSSGVNAPVALPLNKLSTTAFKSPIDGGTGVHTLTQDVDLEAAGFIASVLDSGIAVQVGVDVRIHTSVLITTARVQAWYYDGDPGAGGSIIDSFDSGTLVIGTGGVNNSTYTQIGESRSLPVGTRFVRMTLTGAGNVSFGRHARFTNAFVLLATETPAPTVRTVSLDVNSGLRVVPLGDLDTSGVEGGTIFDPEFKEYVITNQSSSPLSYTVTAIGAPAWIAIDDEPLPLVPTTPPPASGTLSPGESRLITVSIIPVQAALLSEGVFVTTIEFTDITNSATTPRSVNLTILPQMTVVSEDDFFSFGPEGEENFVPASKSYTIKNQGASPITYVATAYPPIWLTLFNAGPDVLAPGATATVIVSINQSQASTLLAISSPFLDTVNFTNVTNGSGNTARAVTLSVEA